MRCHTACTCESSAPAVVQLLEEAGRPSIEQCRHAYTHSHTCMVERSITTILKCNTSSHATRKCTAEHQRCKKTSAPAVVQLLEEACRPLVHQRRQVRVQLQLPPCNGSQVAQDERVTPNGLNHTRALHLHNSNTKQHSRCSGRQEQHSDGATQCMLGASALPPHLSLLLTPSCPLWQPPLLCCLPARPRNLDNTRSAERPGHAQPQRHAAPTRTIKTFALLAPTLICQRPLSPCPHTSS
jgi:hypothetical protein